jgi:hypothetical protein
MRGSPGWSERGGQAFHLAVDAARPSGTVSSLHLLVGACVVAGPVAAWLREVGAAGLRERLGMPVHGDSPRSGGSFAPEASQALGSARAWAAGRGEAMDPEHLVVVLVDQGSGAVRDALTRAGLDAETLRVVALGALGASVDHPLVALLALPRRPAGTVGCPPLPLSELPETAWAQLQARQERLPLRSLRRAWDWSAISVNEQRAVLRLSARLGLDEDETHSLLHHHHKRVQVRAHEAAPHLVPAPRPPEDHPRIAAGFIPGPAGRMRRPGLMFLRGWACWFGNRLVDARAAWLRLTVQH